MNLRYLTTNQAYAFVFGDTIVGLEGHPYTFKSREAALRAADTKGLIVTSDGKVAVRQKLRPTRVDSRRAN